LIVKETTLVSADSIKPQETYTMSKLSCLLIILFLVNITAGLGQDRNFAQYKPGELRAIVRTHADDPELEQSGVKIGSDSVKATATYAGLSHPTPLAKRRFITSFVFQDGTTEDQSGFATEMLFREGKTEFWLMVQDGLVPRFTRELRRGDRVELYVVWVGATYPVRGRREQVFLVNEFRKQEAQRELPLASLAAVRWQIFTGPDNDFTVELPGRPTREPDVQGLGTTVRGYSLVREFVHFQMLFQDTGIRLGDREGDKLPLDFSESRIKDIRQKGGIILRTDLARINVHDLEAWMPYKNYPGQRLHFIERFIARNGRLYMLSCTSTILNQKLDAAVCRRFFDSFRVIRPPQPR
jgi:hypothetical protein